MKRRHRYDPYRSDPYNWLSAIIVVLAVVLFVLVWWNVATFIIEGMP